MDGTVRMMNTLSIIVNDQPGVLVRVAGVFSRFKLNIDSLIVGTAEETGLSCMTIKYECDKIKSEHLSKQLLKLIDVIEIRIV